MAPANSAQALLARMGIHARPDYSEHDRPRLRHTGDLDALRDAALEKGPASTEYAQWMSVLQNGEDENLPDLATFNGAVPQPIAHQAAEIERAQAMSQQHWQLDRIDPRLRTLGWQGVPFADMQPEQARLIALEQLADAQPHEQPEWIAVLKAMDNSLTSSAGIYWEGSDDPDLSYTVPSGGDPSADAYSSWRQAAQQQSGLAALNIEHASVNEKIFAGMSPDGMTYNSADDWTIQTDAANTFPIQS